ncbi:uncharacterized protein N7511_011084, partial [Penicillium nucicola]|uniref:uncharacterized protein n=1 Tax=Penicillium nucicola TaxID=1850975 RepID=UPI002544EF13
MSLRDEQSKLEALINSADRLHFIGCVTCKAKRLKCDETKPTCQQCERRKVSCGGYKKDFKWRPFEETNLAPGKPPKAKKVNPPTQQVNGGSFPTPPTTEQSTSPVRIQSYMHHSQSPPGSLHSSPMSINSFPSEAPSLDELPDVPDDASKPRHSVPLDINVSLSADSPSFNFLSFLEPYQDSLSLADSLA